jgi:hypothetical protein
MIKSRFCNFLLLLLNGISILGYVLCPSTFMSFMASRARRLLIPEFSVDCRESFLLKVTEDHFGCSDFSGTEATFVIEGNVEEFVHHVRSLCQKVSQHRVLTGF